MEENKEAKFVGCVACIYQDVCSSPQFGLGCNIRKKLH